MNNLNFFEDEVFKIIDKEFGQTNLLKFEHLLLLAKILLSQIYHAHRNENEIDYHTQERLLEGFYTRK